MSDPTQETAPEQETVDTPVDNEGTPAEPEDLGALKRALEREREERRQAKEELRRIREDETARTELLKEWGYEVAEDENSEEEDLQFEEDEPKEFRDPRVDEILAREAKQQIRKDLDGFNEGSDWELDDDDRQRIEVDARLRGGAKGFGPDELKKAYDAYIARLERAVEQRSAPKPKPKPPHVTQAGQAGVKTPDLDNDQERQAWMVERFRNLSADS